MRETQRIARRSGQDVSRSFDKANKSVGLLNNSLIRSRTSMLALGAAAGLALTSSTRLIASFEQAMSTVAAVTGATSDQFEALTEKARQLGAVTRFTATQAADGMTFLARAGFQVDEVLGSIEGTLKLAQAGGLDLARAADIASNVLQGMKLEVSETARVVDVLALAANSSNTDVSQLGDALKFVAPIASGLSVGLEETTAAIGALSDAGLQASLAGTGLRRVMIGLEKQSNEGLEVLAKYGLSLDDVRVSSVGLTPALTKLAEAGITTGEAMTLFGLRGGPAFEVLASSIPKIERATDALGKAGGTADKVAATMDDNLNGALLRANSAFQELILAIGDTGPTTALRDAFEGLAKLLQVAAKNADILAIAFVALSARALLPLVASTIPKLITGVAATNVALVNLTRTSGVSTAAVTALGSAMTFIGGPATIAIAAAASAFVVLGRDAEKGREALRRAEAAIEGVQDALEATDKYDDVFYNLGISALDAVPMFNQVRDAIREVAKALDDTVVSGFISDATRIFSQIDEAKAALSEFERQRDAALLASTPAARRSETPESRIARARASGVRTEFDDDIAKARQAVTLLEARFAAMGESVFGDLDLVEAFQKGGLDELQTTLRTQLNKINNQSIIEAEKKRITELQEALSNATSDTARKRFQDQIKEAQEFIKLLEKGIDASTARELSRTQVEDAKTKDELSERELERRQLIRDLELARARDDSVLTAQLETRLDIMDREQEYLEEGLSAVEARRKAEEDIRNLRIGAGPRGAFDEVETLPTPDDDEADRLKRQIEDSKEAFRRSFSDAFRQAMQDGDVGTAITTVFADRAAAGLDEALNDVADLVFKLFSDAFSNSGGSAIGDIFGGIGDFFGFSGNRASGGSVYAGRRYLIGERGPEMFIPTSDGHVVSNEDLRAAGLSGGGGGGGAKIIRQGDIIVHGNLDNVSLSEVQEMMAAQARQLPGVIDATVSDGIARGKY